MIKVLVWGATDTLGGVETVLLNYVKNISHENIQFDFINTYEKISIENDVSKFNSKIISLPNRKKNYFGYRKAIKKFMKENSKEYDIIWLNDCMFGNIDILKLAKKYKIKKRIVHAHNSLSMGGGKSRFIRHKINSFLLRFYVTDYWACSNLAGEWSYPKSINNKNMVQIIPNAIDINLFKLQPNIREQYRTDLKLENKIVFGNVGRFHFQKNHIFLIDIFNEIVKINTNSVLLLIGSGEDQDKIKERIKYHGIEKYVIFLGIRKDVCNLFQAMDVFLLPSLFEGLPVVMVEAQASGLPCFVADTITKEADITGNVKFISLEKSPKDWAKEIMQDIKGFKRCDVSNVIKEKGYSIQEAANKLEEKLMKIY